MNEQKKHIGSIIDRALRSFPLIKVRYQYEPRSECHLIEITPKIEFDSVTAREFIKREILDFYDLFPGTNLTFITEGSLAEITEAELETSNRPLRVPIATALYDIETTVPTGYLTMQDSIQWTAMFQNYFVPDLEKSPQITVTYDLFAPIVSVELVPVESEVMVVDPLTVPNNQIFALFASSGGLVQAPFLRRIWQGIRGHSKEKAKEQESIEYALAA
ncbi:MAG: hypothetical protein WBD36_05315 [Bacteroidota bacterium]